LNTILFILPIEFIEIRKIEILLNIFLWRLIEDKKPEKYIQKLPLDSNLY